MSKIKTPDEAKCEICEGRGFVYIMMAYSTVPPRTGCSVCGGSGLARDTTPQAVAEALEEMRG